MELDGSQCKRTIFITGFGKFHGVEDNPSSILVNDLIESRIPGVNFNAGSSKDSHIVIVDTHHCRLYFESTAPCRGDGDIFVHIGVNGKTDCINLEQYAYNNMDFRVADESGFQPKHEFINDDLPLDEPLETDINVRELVLGLQDQNLPFIVSTDPGRFVCNYMYYLSLQTCVSSGFAKKCLFVHIPPFEKIERAAQLFALQCLISKLYNDYL